jgi:tetratricopeptide (TPR) repeat protein
MAKVPRAFCIGLGLLIGELSAAAGLPASELQRQALNDAGEKAIAQGNFLEADVVFRSALEQAAADGVQDTEFAKSVHGRARALAGAGVKTEAETQYQRALLLHERFNGADSLHVAHVLANFAAMLKSQGRQAEADSLAKRVDLGLARLPGSIEELMAAGNYAAAGESCQLGMAVARKAGDNSMLARLTQLSAEAEFTAERYASAKTKCLEAISAARAAGADSAVAKLMARLATIDYAIQLHGQVAQAIETLDTTPHDPAATSVLGRYLCFVREDWTSGLSLLLESNTSELEAVADAEREYLKADHNALALADRWYALALSAEPGERGAIQRRALHWYQTALQALPPGYAKVKTQHRIAQLSAL